MSDQNRPLEPSTFDREATQQMPPEPTGPFASAFEPGERVGPETPEQAIRLLNRQNATRSKAVMRVSENALRIAKDTREGVKALQQDTSGTIAALEERIKALEERLEDLSSEREDTMAEPGEE